MLSALLLSIFLFNIIGYYFLFKIQQYEVRKEIKSKIKNNVPENDLILLSFHPSSKEYSEIEWIKNHEFRYKGQLFDIVRLARDNDGTIRYKCINDKQEEILFENLDEWVQKHMESESNSDPSSKNILKLFSIVYFSSTQVYFLEQNTTLSLKSDYIFHYSSPALEIISPPPQLA